MVVVSAVEQFDMQSEPGGLRDGVKPVLDQFGIPFAQLFLGEARLPHEIGPA